MPFIAALPPLLGLLVSIAISFALNAVIGLVSKAFIKKPKRSPLGFDDRTLTLSGSIQPRTYIYGENRVGGTVVFIQRSADGADVWLVIAIAGHQVQDIRDIYFNDVQTLYGTDGIINSGANAGKATIFEHLGTTTQAADANLKAAFPNKWTDDHKLSGCAYAVVRLIAFTSNWSGSVPNLSFDVKGANQIADPRGGSAGYSDNAALCIRDWLLSTVGMGEVAAALNDNAFRASATLCEEFVPFESSTRTAFKVKNTTFTAAIATDLCTLAANIDLNTGDPVCVSTTTTLPAPLVAATLYYWIRVSASTGKLAATIADATAGTPINITTTGAGTHTMTSNAGVALTPTDQTVTATAATDLINLGSPIFGGGMRVRMTTTGTMPAPLVAGTAYYTTNTGGAGCSLLDSVLGSLINITTAGTPTITLTVDGWANIFTAVSTSNDSFSFLEDVGIPTGTELLLGTAGTLPAPLIAGNVYYAIALGNNSYRLAETAAKARKGIYIDLTTAGAGSHSVETDFNPVIEMQGLVTGDMVQITATGGSTLPGGLASGTDYYWIRLGRNSGLFASNLANALAGIGVVITDPGATTSAGMFDVRRTRQRRFTCNGLFDADQTREEVLKALLTSCGGFAAPLPKWALYPATYRPPLLSLTEDHVRRGGVIELTARNARRETFNTVTGVYVTPENFDQPSSFPQLQDPDALAEDGGDTLAKDITLPFTNNKAMALRLARIELNRARLQNSLSFPANLAAYPCQVGDSIDINIAAFGWNKKIFEVIGWDFKLENDGGADNGALLPAIDLRLRETSPWVYR